MYLIKKKRVLGEDIWTIIIIVFLLLCYFILLLQQHYDKQIYMLETVRNFKITF